jgi:hypothetical protein
MDFKKSDIPALDFIIDKILDTNFPVFSNDLVDAGFITKETYRENEKEFEYLLSIIEQNGCAKVNPRANEDSGTNATCNISTAKFKKDGGFTSLFDKLQEEEKREKETRQKNRYQYKLAKWQYITFWPLFLIALISLVVTISNYIRNQKRINKLEQNIQDSSKQLKELQISISSQIALDSSFHENVDKKIKFLLSNHSIRQDSQNVSSPMRKDILRKK